MGEIIKHWLTYKLGLECPSADGAGRFEHKLANGVLIAEILRKYGVLSDDEFISLPHNSTQKTRLDNMRHIEGWLNGSGLKIKESDLEDIAKEKVGVGAKLLYQLYLWFEYGQRASKTFESPQKGFDYGIAKNGQRQGTKLSNWKDGEKEKNGQKLQNGKSYTSYDRIEFPRRVTHEKPYVESSEATQAQHLYFHHRAIEVLQKQNEERIDFARSRKLRLLQASAKVKASGDWSIDSVPPDSLDPLSIRSRQKEATAAVRDAQIQEALNDMHKFNLEAQNPCLLATKVESQIPIYSNGLGDPCEYDLKVKLLQCKREAETREDEARTLIRTQILNRFHEETSVKMLKALEEDILKGLTQLPATERLLAGFLSCCREEKDHFIKHSLYEARQLQEARNLDLDKEVRFRQKEEEFKQYASAEMANPRKTFDFVCRTLEEPDLLAQLATADDTIKDMMERALKIKPPPPPPPPPCTPTFTFRKRCREVIDDSLGPILICEDEIVGEGRDSGFSICRILPQENVGEGE